MTIESESLHHLVCCIHLSQTHKNNDAPRQLSFLTFSALVAGARLLEIPTKRASYATTHMPGALETVLQLLARVYFKRPPRGLALPRRPPIPGIPGAPPRAPPIPPMPPMEAIICFSPSGPICWKEFIKSEHKAHRIMRFRRGSA